MYSELPLTSCLDFNIHTALLLKLGAYSSGKKFNFYLTSVFVSILKNSIILSGVYDAKSHWRHAD